MTLITVTDQAVARVQAVRDDKKSSALRLRVTVEGGGCSGFQYIFSWDETVSADDEVFADALVTDKISLPLLEGSTVDYIVSMMGEDFKITNPNAVSGCGCGTSFAV
jgi:iron-sulfur cluster insertion protein